MFECAFINTTEETKVFVGQLTWELLNQICMYIDIYIYLVLLFIGLYSLYGMTFYDLDIFLYMCWHNTHVIMVVLSKIFKRKGHMKMLASYSAEDASLCIESSIINRLTNPRQIVWVWEGGCLWVQEFISYWDFEVLMFNFQKISLLF